MIDDLIHLYFSALFIISTLALLASVRLMTHSYHRGSQLMTIVLVSLVVVMTGFAFQITANDGPTILFWNRVQSIGYETITAAWPLFALEFTGRGRWVNRWSVIAFALVPGATLIAVNLPGALVVQNTFSYIGPKIVLNQTTTPFGSFSTIYMIGVQLLCCALFARFILTASGTFRRQSITLLVGSLIPFASLVYEAAGINPLAPYTTLPLAFGLSGLITSSAILFSHIGQVLPIVREKLVEEMRDGLVVIDNNHLVLDLNPAARRILHLKKGRGVGDHADQIWADLTPAGVISPELLAAGGEFTLEWPNEKNSYDVRCSPFYTASGHVDGQMILFRDVTGHERLEENLFLKSAQLARQNAFITALSRVASRLEASRNPDQILATLGSELASIGLTCFVGIIRESDGKLAGRYTSIPQDRLALGEQIANLNLMDFAIEVERLPSLASARPGSATFIQNPLAVASDILSWVPRAAIKALIEHSRLQTNLRVVSLPLFEQERLVGLLAVWGETLREGDLPALGIFANQVAGNLTYARLYSETDRLRAFNQSIVQGVAEAILITSAGGHIQFANPAAEQLCGLEAEGLYTLNLSDFLPDAGDVFPERGDTRRFQLSLVSRRGAVVPVMMSRRKLSTEGHPNDWLVVITDISARVRAEQDLRRAEERYQSLVEQIPAVTYIRPPEVSAAMLYISPQIKSLSGIPSPTWEQAAGLWLERLDPRDRGKVLAQVEEAWQSGKPTQLEYRLVHPDGGFVWVHDEAVFIQRENKTYLQGILTNVTARHTAEEILESSLHEKEIMLKEIHHRVKNNLQIISSLLNLEQQRMTPGPALEAFRDSQSRIRTMALIHERLYRAQDLSRIDFGEYIRKLTSDLFANYSIAPQAIQLEIDIPCEIFIPVDNAIPCGLIINELVSNSLKHAFVGRTQGHIWIRLAQQPGQIDLEVGDDGVGFAADNISQPPETLGLQLIEAMIEQMNGTHQLRSCGGTCFFITFPLLVARGVPPGKGMGQDGAG